jgi:polyphosphate kinase 2 (PPK2 family)
LYAYSVAPAIWISRAIEKIRAPGAEVLRQKPYKQAVTALRLELVNAQFRLMAADFAVLLLLAADDRSACNRSLTGSTNGWTPDTSTPGFMTCPPRTEALRPTYWRYWRAMPPKGRTGLYAGAWMIGTIGARIRGDISRKEYQRRVEHLVALDRTVAANGTLIVIIMDRCPAKRRGTSCRPWTSGGRVSRYWKRCITP